MLRPNLIPQWQFNEKGEFLGIQWIPGTSSEQAPRQVKSAKGQNRPSQDARLSEKGHGDYRKAS